MAFYLKDRVYNGQRDFTADIERALSGVALPGTPSTDPKQLIVIQGDKQGTGQALYILSGNSPTRVTNQNTVNNVCRLYRDCYGESSLPPLIPYMHATLPAPSSNPSPTPPSSIQPLTTEPAAALLTQMQAQIDALTNKVRSLNESARTTIIDETNRARAVLQNDQIAFLDRIANERQKLIEEMTSWTNDHQRDLNHFKDQIAQFHKTLYELTPKINKTDERMAKLPKKLNEKFNELYSALKSDLEKQEKESQSLFIDLKERLNTLQATVTTLSQNQGPLNNHANAIETQLKGQFKQLSNQLTELLDEKLNSTSTDLAQTQQNNQTLLNTNIQGLQQELAEINNTLNNQYNELSKKWETTLQTNSTADSELREQFAGLSTAFETLMNAVNGISTAQRELPTQLQAAITPIQEKLDLIQSNITDNVTNIIENRIDGLIKDLDQISARAENLINENKQETIREIQNETSALSSKLSAGLSSLEETISALATSVSTLSEDNGQSFIQINDRLTAFVTAVNLLTESVNSLTASLEEEPLTAEKLEALQSAIDSIQRSLDLAGYNRSAPPISYVPNETVTLLREQMRSLQDQFKTLLQKINEELPSMAINADHINTIVSGVKSDLASQMEKIKESIEALKDEFHISSSSIGSLSPRSTEEVNLDETLLGIDNTPSAKIINEIIGKDNQYKDAIYTTLSKTLNDAAWLKNPSAISVDHNQNHTADQTTLRWLSTISSEYTSFHNLVNNRPTSLHKKLSNLTSLDVTKLITNNDESKFLTITQHALRLRIYLKLKGTSLSLDYENKRVELEKVLVELYNRTKPRDKETITEFPTWRWTPPPVLNLSTATTTQQKSTMHSARSATTANSDASNHRTKNDLTITDRLTHRQVNSKI